MRLSEDRINFITDQIVKELLDAKALRYGGSKIVMESEITRVIIEDLKIEEDIDREVTEMLDKMTKTPPQGSAEWSALYMQKKEEIARRKNYIL